MKTKSIKYNETSKVYALDVDLESINCKIQNYIYVLTCLSCQVQHVGESASPLNIRVNIHRTGKSGCEISIDHYNNVCPGASFSIKILENLPGTGYINGVFDKAMHQQRLTREDYWIKTLRTVYPYGLNKRTKSMFPLVNFFHHCLDMALNSLVNILTLLINLKLLTSILSSIPYFSFPTSERSNKSRKLFNRLKHSNLKNLASEASSNLKHCEDKHKRWLDLVIDVFLTKIYKEDNKKKPKKAPKQIIPIYFHNKGLDFIQLQRILRRADVVSKLPEKFQSADPSAVVYSLSSTIRNKVFNYKETVNNIDVTDEISYGTNLPSCECSTSPFVDPDHGHIVTGDLRLIENQHLRKLLSKGPNYREPKNINWKKSKDVIANGLETFINDMSAKSNVDINTFRPWKDEILQQVEGKITSLKRKMKYKKVNPILERQEVVEYLQDLQSKFVIVPIDKAANNVSFICKRFYVEVILKEIGVLGQGNDTYLHIDSTKEEIINENIRYSEKLKFEMCDKDESLPITYWIPKKHKTPTGKRFIIASKNCSTKKLSTAVSNVFKMIFHQVENFHVNAKFLSNYNKFWVLQNCNPVLESLNRINKKRNAKSMSTFDFSTLYTKIPHNLLIKELSDIIDFFFEGGGSKFISISKYNKAY